MFKKIVSVLLVGGTAFGQTIAEKKASLNQTDGGMSSQLEERLHFVNDTLWEKKQRLKQKTEEAYTLFAQNASEESYLTLLEEIRALKEEIFQTQEMWRLETSSMVASEGYSLWNQPDATLLQLVLDYGATDYLYVVPPELGTLRISVTSHLPIPKEAWDECLLLILQQNGIGVRTLSPYLKELYKLEDNQGRVETITDDPKQLEFLPAQTRVCFVLAPSSPDPRRSYNFLNEFANATTTTIHLIGGKIFIVTSAQEVTELLKLYQFANDGAEHATYKLVPISKVCPEQMQVLLEQSFGKEEGSLQVTPLGSALFLSGAPEQVQKGEKMIEHLQATIEDPKEKTVFWYTAKHSDPEELSDVLAQVYELLIAGASFEKAQKVAEKALAHDEERKPGLPVKSISVGNNTSSSAANSTNASRNNFIVDPKTGAIIMVVEQEALEQIQKLLKKLDVPKKMVQLEVLLFEKKRSAQNNIGLNLLKLGNQVASGMSAASMMWNPVGAGAGILEFMISRKKGSGIPAYDLTYNFLLGQEDVQINASPSVTTINQTPATIALVEEISINTGASKEKDGPKTTYDRKQFGIKIEITPTINQGEHEKEGDSEKEFITLDTDITFDTPKASGHDERPNVSRRYIKNHVRIADGETVILGGLRLKTTEDSKDSIPFLGEIPGLGKLFSSQEMSESSTEMFIFITPKIIADPVKDAKRITKEMLKKRPGDVPEFVAELLVAKEKEKKRLFEQSLTALFGRNEPLVHSEGKQVEYDGRS